jgi:hypothetical protein
LVLTLIQKSKRKVRWRWLRLRVTSGSLCSTPCNLLLLKTKLRVISLQTSSAQEVLNFNTEAKVNKLAIMKDGILLF